MAQVLAGHGAATDAPPSSGADSANSNGEDFEFAMLLPIVAEGTATALYVKSTDAVTARRGAIYAYNGTVTLTGRARLSGDITPPTAGAGAYAGWHKYTVSPGVAITGTNIWVAFVCTTATYAYTDFATTGGTTRDTASISTLLDPHPATGVDFTNRFNAFVEGDTEAVVAQMPAYNPGRMLRTG